MWAHKLFISRLNLTRLKDYQKCRIHETWNTFSQLILSVIFDWSKADYLLEAIKRDGQRFVMLCRAIIPKDDLELSYFKIELISFMG